MNPLLEVESVRVVREGRTLLEDVSLTALPGQIHALVGPNGAGKSTLLSCILGFTDFDGAIRFHFRGGGRVGYVPQKLLVDQTLPLTAGEFLALPRTRLPACLGLSRRARLRADELLARVRLEGFAGRPLGALSGGELQRVLLANALDPAPELLLLDEPASGMDETSNVAFEETLRALGAGTAVLLVSHDLPQVRRLAARVTVLDRSVRRSGRPEAALQGTLAESLS